MSYVPAEFMLAGRVWKVKRCTEKAMKKHTGKADAYACCDLKAGTLWINEGVPDDMLAITFEHELEHAIAYTRGIVEGHDEVLIDAVAHLRAQARESEKGALA